jgi:hydrogenase maturation protease
MPMQEVSRILVLGLGNDLLTDDAVGLRVARAAGARLGGRPDAVVRETMEMGLALLDEIVGFESLVVVDAIQTGRAPAGRIHEFGAGELDGRRLSAPHFLGIAETLFLGQRLGLPMPRRVRVVAVEVGDPFTLGTQMTAAVEAAVEEAAARVARLVDELAAAPRAMPAALAP